MVGIVTHDDVIDVVVEEATEDAYRMGAVGPMAENYLEANFVTVWRKRAFWLSCLFLAELFTFSALAHFEDAIAEVVVLSLFVPLCISTGGNSGSQAATLITRAMALGQVTNRDWFRVLRHELVMGLALGLTLGAIGFVRAYFTPDSVRGGVDRFGLAQVICLAVMCICLWGTIVGSMLPLGFKRLGVDPGIASSPFVATFVDVTGIIIYFTIASSILLSGLRQRQRRSRARTGGDLAGVWKVTSRETNGDLHHAADWEKLTSGEGIYFVFANEKLIILDPLATKVGQKPEPAEFSIDLDPGKTPRTFDAVMSGKREKEKKLLALYKHDGDQLTICITDGETSDRPTSFEAGRNSNLTMWTLIRPKK